MSRHHHQGSQEPARLRTIFSLFRYLWPQDRADIKLRVVISLALLAAAKVVNVALPLMFKDLLDSFSMPVTLFTTPLLFICAYGLAKIAAGAFGDFRDVVFASVAQNAIRTASLETFRHLHNLSLRFHLERRTGGLSRAIERGTEGIQFFLAFSLFNIIPTLLEITFVCGILGSKYHPRYALITFFSVAVYIAFTLGVTEWRNAHRRKMNEADSEAHSKAVDSLLNYETVKYFSREAHEAARFDEFLCRYEKAAVKNQQSLALLNIGQGSIIAIGLAAVMALSAAEVQAGSMSIGDFVLVHTFLLQLYLPLNFLGFVYRQMKQSMIDMEAMFALLAKEREIADVPGAIALQVKRGEVRFNGVGFAYKEEVQILKDVSFSVGAGKRLAIVGPSGAGKSTISRLLFRFYEAQRGEIFIDGLNIASLTQESLRASIGIVPQDTVLFNDTIYYNIAYAKPEASEAEVIRAAGLAQIHDFVSGLPEGYQTTVGERGLKLSGGEKQRVAIARALLKDPPILVLDEATSALDTHTEQRILQALDTLAKGRTTIVIAHRLSTIANADEIAVLDGGVIQERGTHDELIAKGGAYADMWRKQQEQGGELQ